MGILQRLLRQPDGVAVEPQLSPASQERYRRLSSPERRRILRRAEKEAAGSLRVDPSRNFTAALDAFIECELDGTNRGLEAAVQAELGRGISNPEERRLHWSVAVGQDDPPDGLWGWMIVNSRWDSWPPEKNVLWRTPVAFMTAEEARVAGEAFADELWVKTNRGLAGLR